MSDRILPIKDTSPEASPQTPPAIPDQVHAADGFFQQHATNQGANAALPQLELTSAKGEPAKGDIPVMPDSGMSDDHPSLEAKQFAGVAKDVLAKIDVQHKGYVDLPQLQAALADPQFKGQEAQALAALNNNFDALRQFNLFGPSRVTVADLDRFQAGVDAEDKVRAAPGETAPVSDSTLDNLRNSIEGDCWKVARHAQTVGISYDLYANNNPQEAVNPSAVQQGTVGDCYFEATVAALAAADPTVLQNSIHDNQNGTFTVTFPGWSWGPVTVSKPTEAELGLYNHGNEDGEWASVIEKAFGVFYMEGRAKIDEAPQKYIGYGGRPENVIPLLTDHHANVIEVAQHNQAYISTMMEQAFQPGQARVVVADTGANEKFDDTAENDRLINTHSYSVLGFTPDSNGGGQVLLRDPYGNESTKPDGRFEMTLDEFTRAFADFVVES